MSMLENLENIKRNGIREFVKIERESGYAKNAGDTSVFIVMGAELAEKQYKKSINKTPSSAFACGL